MLLKGKRILVISGSLLSAAELRQEFARHGANVFVSGNLFSVFELLRKLDFAGAVLDHSLHNEAFDLCTELEAYDVPYVWSRESQKSADYKSRQHQGRQTVARLLQAIERNQASHRDGGWSTVADVQGDDHVLELR